MDAAGTSALAGGGPSRPAGLEISESQINDCSVCPLPFVPFPLAAASTQSKSKESASKIS